MKRESDLTEFGRRRIAGEAGARHGGRDRLPVSSGTIIDRGLDLYVRALETGVATRIAWVSGESRGDVRSLMVDLESAFQTVGARTKRPVVASVRCSLVAGAYEAMERVAAEIGHLVSQKSEEEAVRLFANTSPGSDVARSFSRWSFFRAVTRWLVKLSHETPLVLMLEDIDRLDSASWDLIGYLVGAFTGTAAGSEGTFRGLVVLGAPNRDDAIRNGLGTTFSSEVDLNRWVQTDQVRRLAASSLDRAAIADLLKSEQLLDMVWDRTKGRPGNLQALFESLPESVEDLNWSRIQRLDRRARHALDALAVFGRPCPLAVAAGVGVETDTVDFLRRERFVTADDAIELVRSDDRDRLLGALTDRERTGWHKALGSAIEATAGPSEYAARHYTAAGDLEAAARTVALAVDELASRHAHNVALELIADLLARGGAFAPLADRAISCARAMGRYDLALRYSAKARVGATGRGKFEHLRDAAEFLMHLGRYSAASGVVAWAKRRAESVPADLRNRFAALEAEILFHEGDVARASEVALHALSALSQHGADDSLRMTLDNVLGKIAWQTGAYEEALSRFQLNLLRAERNKDAGEKARALTNLATVQMERDNHLRAEDLLKAAIREADAACDLPRLAAANLNLANLYLMQCDYGRALEAYERATLQLRQVGRRVYLARVACNFAELLATIGDTRRAKALAQEALEIAETAGDQHVTAMALLFGAHGAEDPAFAEQSLKRAAQLFLESGSPRYACQASLKLVDLLIASGARDRARSLLNETMGATGSESASNAPDILMWHLVLEAKLLEEDREGAAARILRAIRMAENTGDTEAAQRFHREIAAVERLRGAWDAAERHYLAAERLITKMRTTLPEAYRASFDEAHSVTDFDADLRSLNVEREFAAKPPPKIAKGSSDGMTDLHAPRSRAPFKARRMLAVSENMVRVSRMIERIAPTSSTVLVLGESGTGKELVAEAIHEKSLRRSKPFVSVNCAALVESLLLSELFGHEKGAFTGAAQRRIGHFEAANGGTLFLDEIGDISPATQVALLRVLQEREFERVGGVDPVRVDIRIVCATNRNLEAMVAAGRFREDLYYRLNCVTIALPALRDRRDDISHLAALFLRSAAAEMGKPHLTIADSALDLMRRYPWPGNIRELENVVRSLAFLVDGDTIGAADVSALREFTSLGRAIDSDSRLASVGTLADIGAAKGDGPLAADFAEQIMRSNLSLSELKKQIELSCIARALQETNGNITQAATRLKMKRPRLSQIIKANLESLRSLQIGNA